ncbi:MAG: bestrophin-like domain [Planctomycetota bacterium]
MEKALARLVEKIGWFVEGQASRFVLTRGGNSVSLWPAAKSNNQAEILITMTEEAKNIELLFYEFPLWGILLITLGILFAAFEGGFLLGRHRYKHSSKAKDSPVGPMVAATLGLLAFMLTFTFGIAASHFNTRRYLVLDEANAIWSTYAMTEMLTDDPSAQSKELLREYVDIRLKNIQSFGELKDLIFQSNAIQDKLWSIAMSGEVKGTGTSSAWLYVQSLSDMINMQTKRISYGAHGRVPTSIWVVVYWLAILGMAAMGYHAGLVGKRGFFAYMVLIFTFSMVIVLIYDLDRPKQQLFKVSQQTMINLQQRINE